MKELQAALQSRISKRSAQITDLELDRMYYKMNKDYEEVWLINSMLKDLREDQSIDKLVMRNVYWGKP